MAKLEELLPCPVLREEPMAKHTSLGVGGPAEYLVLPQSEEDICAAVCAARDQGLPLTVLGAGTNVIVRDAGIRGLVLMLGAKFRGVNVEEELIVARAGTPLAEVCRAAAERGLAGMEWAAGIPGSVGGALAMNAGAFGGAMSDIVLTVRALTREGQFVELSREQMRFGYRTSLLRREPLVAVSAALALRKESRAKVEGRQRELLARRRKTQPLDMPSAGSVFKRPPGDYAGRLIEQAGLKGLRVGGAEVSEKHANFIVNTGGATARDVLQLIARIQHAVRERFGVTLEPEVVVLGEDAR